MLKKLIIVFSAFLFLVYFPKEIRAQWTKYENNPVLKPSSGQWDSVHVVSPSVLHEDNKFKMWYQGFNGANWRIGYAESDDGINWQKNSNNPIIKPKDPGLENEIGVTEPTVIHNTNGYQMWFNAFQQYNYFKIKTAYSGDGIHWTINSAPVLQGTTGTWDANGVTNPFVLYDGQKYHMWYSGWGNNSNWKIGYAASPDGINWSKPMNTPLNLPSYGFVNSPTVLILENKFHMWYQTGSNTNTDFLHVTSDDGINWICADPCYIMKIESNKFDSHDIVAPSVLKINSELMMWYGGSNGINFQIGLATENLPKKKTPIVIIPGIMTSWNKEAILHNQTRPLDEWSLLKFVKEYDGLVNTLKNLSYQENSDFYVFPYDWRKGIKDTSNDLNNFITQRIWNNNKDQKINIIGHSLGGVIARDFAQNHPDKIESLITVGSPLKGSAQTYKPLEGGEIEKDNTFMWLAQKLILILNKDTFETDRETIQKKFPVLYDIFPTINFLKKKDGNMLNIDNLSIKNSLLPSFNNFYKTVYGEKGNTLSGFTIDTPNLINQILGNYPDGEPVSSYNEIGDYVVTSNSAKGNNSQSQQQFAFDHGEIITEKSAIKSILEMLNVPYQDNQIASGNKTNISPSLIFFILSPATMEVTNQNNETFYEQDGLIFIENAKSGDYTLKVKGQELGRYTIFIAQINDNKDIWSKIEGEITASPPNTQVDNYSISFDINSLQQYPINVGDPLILFNDLTLFLKDINRDLNNKELLTTINNVSTAKNYFQQKKSGQLKSTLLLIHQKLFKIRNDISYDDKKRQIIEAVGLLENLYEKTLGKYQSNTAPAMLKKDLNNYTKSLSNVKNYLLAQKKQGKDVVKNGKILIEIENRINLSQENLDKKNNNAAEILLKSINELIKEARKI